MKKIHMKNYEMREFCRLEGYPPQDQLMYDTLPLCRGAGGLNPIIAHSKLDVTCSKCIKKMNKTGVVEND